MGILPLPAETDRERGEGPKVVLASGGKAHFPIVITPGSHNQVREAAEDLRRILTQITGAEFEVRESSQTTGILLGTGIDWSDQIEIPERINSVGNFHREEYFITTGPEGVRLLGSTPLGAQHAVWDFLGEIGYRQYFPGEIWEIIPNTPRLEVGLNIKEAPDFHSRRIWYGYGMSWGHNREPYADWVKRNRSGQGFNLQTGHAYQRIIQSNRELFDANPDFYALVNGEREYRRSISKFNIANPELRKFVVQFALQYFKNNPDADSISMDPSDGGGWSESEESRALGSVTDEALYLANAVANEVQQRFGEKYVGMYAYHEHSPPPNIEVHPQVIISVATSFIRGGFTFEELVEGWKTKGARMFGIRDYFSVNTWDRDLPGRPVASNLPRLLKAIPRYHELGGRFFSGEASDNWGPNGLPYFMASRMLWDVKEADRFEYWFEDFLKNCFGPTAEPMRSFYQRIHHLTGRPLLSEDLIGRLYRDLQAAYQLAGNEVKIRQRIEHLVLYVHYVERYQRYANASGEARQEAFEQLLGFSWRIRESMMIHSLALYRDLVGRDRQVTLPANSTWNRPEDENPIKSGTFPSAREIRQILTAGVRNHKLMSFEPVSFSDDLIPAGEALALDPEAYPDLQGPQLSTRGTRNFYVWVPEAPASIRFEGTAGRIGARDAHTEVTLYPVSEVFGASVDEVTFPNDRQPHQLELKTTYPGLHRVQVVDRGALTTLKWEPGLKVTLVESIELTTAPYHRSSRYFYVPKGTKVVGGFGDGVGVITDSSGNPVYDFDKDLKGQGYFEITVPKGQDGKLWTMRNNAGTRILMTVPSYFARNPAELLLPREVVEADQD